MCNVYSYANVERGKDRFFDKCSARGYRYDRALTIWDWIVERRKKAERQAAARRTAEMIARGAEYRRVMGTM